MATNKTTETNNSVTEYMDAIADEKKRKDCAHLTDIFSRQSGFPPKMWGAAIIGFGSYHYRYESGHEGDAPLTAFSARKNAIVLYLGGSFATREELLARLGKHKSGKGCVYIQKLPDIDIEVLSEMISCSVSYYRNKYLIQTRL